MKSSESASQLRPPVLFSFGEVDSALDVAYRLAVEEKLLPFDSVLCTSQRHGRGQMRRVWHSPEGNIYAAIRLPSLPPFTGDAASPATAFLIARALSAMGFCIRIKWPNDLVLLSSDGPRKVGGILLEERGGTLFAGIGINLYSAPSDALLRRDHALPATALFTAQKQGPKAQKFWQSLVIKAIKAYKEDDSFADIWQKSIQSYLLWIGTSVCLSRQDERVGGLFLGLGPNGGILLDEGGHVSEYMSGSLESRTG